MYILLWRCESFKDSEDFSAAKKLLHAISILFPNFCHKTLHLNNFCYKSCNPTNRISLQFRFLASSILFPNSFFFSLGAGKVT